MTPKNLLLALLASAAVLPAIDQPASAQDCDYVSYAIVDGQCVDMTNVSKRGALGLKKADLLRQQNPIVEQNFKVAADPDDEDAALVTGKLYNQSRRAVRVYTISVRLTDYNMRDETVEVNIGQVVQPGETISFRKVIPSDMVNLNNARATLVSSAVR